MKYPVLSDLVADPKYDSFNINKKRDLVKRSENTKTYKEYMEIVKTDMAPTDKGIYYQRYLKATELIFDLVLENVFK